MLYIDLESDGLLREATKVHCLVAYDDEKNMYHIYATEPFVAPVNAQCYENIKDILYVLNTAPVLCSFNGIMFDLPLLKKLHGFEYNLNKQVDLCLDSRLQYPDREGHSLEYFGQLLGFPKWKHSDWTRFSQEMLDYCIQDTRVTEKAYPYLKQEAGDWPWTEAKKLEYKIADIQMRQEMKGVLFDVPRAVALSATIKAELATIEEEVLKGIPLKAVQHGATVSKPFLKNGKITEAVNKWILEGHSQGLLGSR